MNLYLGGIYVKFIGIYIQACCAEPKTKHISFNNACYECGYVIMSEHEIYDER